PPAEASPVPPVVLPVPPEAPCPPVPPFGFPTAWPPPPPVPTSGGSALMLPQPPHMQRNRTARAARTTSQDFFSMPEILRGSGDGHRADPEPGHQVARGEAVRLHPAVDPGDPLAGDRGSLGVLPAVGRRLEVAAVLEVVDEEVGDLWGAGEGRAVVASEGQGDPPNLSRCRGEVEDLGRRCAARGPLPELQRQAVEDHVELDAPRLLVRDVLVQRQEGRRNGQREAGRALGEAEDWVVPEAVVVEEELEPARVSHQVLELDLEVGRGHPSVEPEETALRVVEEAEVGIVPEHRPEAPQTVVGLEGWRGAILEWLKDQYRRQAELLGGLLGALRDGDGAHRVRHVPDPLAVRGLRLAVLAELAALGAPDGEVVGGRSLDRVGGPDRREDGGEQPHLGEGQGRRAEDVGRGGGQLPELASVAGPLRHG